MNLFQSMKEFLSAAVYGSHAAAAYSTGRVHYKNHLAMVRNFTNGGFVMVAGHLPEHGDPFSIIVSRLIKNEHLGVS